MPFGMYVKVEDSDEGFEKAIKQILYCQSIGAGVVIDNSSLSSNERKTEFSNVLKYETTQYDKNRKRQVD